MEPKVPANEALLVLADELEIVAVRQANSYLVANELTPVNECHPAPNLVAMLEMAEALRRIAKSREAGQ